MKLDEGISILVQQIDEMVETVSIDKKLDQSEVRRTLRFISQVIQVAEQAFQDVLTLLVDVKFLTADDLYSTRLIELRKRVDLLTARSHFRDAMEICSRLRHLHETFDSDIKPAFDHLPDFSGWCGVLRLIDEHEGRIIMLIQQTAYELDLLLSSADEEKLPEINAAAARTADELRTLLARLHELNGRILGFSGREGLLELTRDRRQLEREIQIMIDNRDQRVHHGHQVQLGDNNTVQNLVVATTVQDSFKTIQSAPVGNELKQTLTRLCEQVEVLLKSLPPEKQKEVKQDLSTLVEEATKEEPRKKWFELSANGLIEAAKACAGAASPVISTVTALLALMNR